jgi:hypothetical protein
MMISFRLTIVEGTDTPDTLYSICIPPVISIPSLSPMIHGVAREKRNNPNAIA